MLIVILNSELDSKHEDIKTRKDLRVVPNFDITDELDMYANFEQRQHIVDGITNNSFVDAFITSYNNHIPLRIKPDHIAFMLKQIFNTCINKNGELLRNLFVAHSDKKAVTVEVMNLDMKYISEQFKQKTEEHIINKEFVKQFCQRYSTTTDFIQTVSNITFVNSMMNYFRSYIIFHCGIPAVILEGTQDDWQLVNNFYLYCKNLLKNTELKDWFTHFDVIMNLFVSMRNLQSSGIVEATDYIKDMWKRSVARIPCCCSNDVYLGGWIILFIPYDCNNVFNRDLIKEKLDVLDLSITPPIRKETPPGTDIRFYLGTKWTSLPASHNVTNINIQYVLQNIDTIFIAGIFNPYLTDTTQENSLLEFVRHESLSKYKFIVSPNIGLIVRSK